MSTNFTTLAAFTTAALKCVSHVLCLGKVAHERRAESISRTGGRLGDDTLLRLPILKVLSLCDECSVGPVREYDDADTKLDQGS